ncbi:MAG: bifunctional chorismate mutase/prephenate dehydrogenase [Cyanobacteria bacterium SID2]|nr:bifunctional chorismate mutase/prephenate dehydrogenase [Cyanobacteria bacterium SID2]MBP0003593.1 bifunctional chorismate mutase/prephenate dehydrogenase [Cyanobacteria bacterium SBC]
MSENSLQDIDRQLVELLRKRMALLARSTAEPISIERSELQQAGVPAFVWHSVVTSCTAALARKPLTSSIQRRIAIVGGKGVMGQFFRQRFEEANCEVRVLGRTDWPHADEILDDVDLALVSVPIDRTLDIIRDTAKHLPKTAVLADITSIKGPAVEAMLAAHPGPVVGLHPMFGPGVESFLSQKVAICPGREPEAWQWLVDLMDKDGGDLVYCTPEEHDRIMVMVQAIRHFSTFGLGVFLAAEGIDIGRSLELSSPIYRLGIDMVSRLFGQDASLYVDIMLANSERRESIERFADTFAHLAQLVRDENRQELIDEFVKATRTFGEETERAVRESDRLINAMSVFLAADRVQRHTTLPEPPPS